MEDLHVSTITAILQLSSDIDLKQIFEEVPISTYIPFIEYGETNGTKGFSKKLLKKKRKKKKKRIFYNQATIHVNSYGKLMNVKLFNNGKIQITGLKQEGQSVELVNELILYLQYLDIFKEDVSIIHSQIVLINSDFDLGFKVNREMLHREIINMGIYSSFEPCIYPGVNIKYYMNTNNSNGICCCNNICNGKGRANGDGDCKKVTIAVFMSGKTIITGGQNKDQLKKCHQFITNFIDERKEFFELK
tara:strand:- start:630 stop:1370 length:741 start_codon:yes stop_codon:yes gene_type:complete